MKEKKMDLSVLGIMIFFTVMDLFITTIEPSISSSTNLNILEFFKGFGSIIVIVKFAKDSNYKFGYLLSGTFTIIVLEFMTFSFIDFYFKMPNLYWTILIQGVISAFLYSYIFQSFKKYSYESMKELEVFKD
ncbi:hypothetical protein NRK67_13905 [Fusobacteria bacterium ZRK30]|nr:hypothetical protein NRK67_13905 [Fusobacteria bacterium ZRK30]